MADVSIGGELQALPLGFLLAAPMKAAIEAQAIAAQTTADFIQNVCLDSSSGTSQAVMIDFTFKQTLPDPTDPSTTVTRDVDMSVPLLAITQVPYLRINDLTVNFEFKIRDTQSVTSNLKLSNTTSVTDSSSFKGDYSAGGGLLSFLGGAKSSASYQNDFKFTTTASVTYQRTERHDTDRSATFKMNLNALQDPIPEGMRRVLEIMSDAIKATTAIATSPPPPPGPPPSPPPGP